MKAGLRYARALALGAGLLTGCAAPLASVQAPPPPTPASAVAAPLPQRSARSELLARYYAQLQADLLTQGLLRRDGGGTDTPYDAETLARNFETIAFYDEYAPGAGLGARGSTAGQLRRWSGPVRMGMVFGPSAGTEQQRADRAAVTAFAARLARVTGHPVTVTDSAPNFHVLFMGEDDGAELSRALDRLLPDIGPSTRRILTTLPRSIHCLVVAFSDGSNPYGYTRALALIRTEHPDLIRLSCIHEELAQGMGLANDSPAARPSIFNDDDEFALLTGHDERLLKMLYDPRLTLGMGLDEARPVIRILAREAIGADL